MQTLVYIGAHDTMGKELLRDSPKCSWGLVFVMRSFFEFATIRSTRQSYNHSHKLSSKLARANYKSSFFLAAIKPWNNLPRGIVEADFFQLVKSTLKLLRFIRSLIRLRLYTVDSKSKFALYLKLKSIPLDLLLYLL